MYNAENTISTCINSVLNQTYNKKIEIIVINDGSKDNSKKIVEEIININHSDLEIKLINKDNGGVSSARNTGMVLAKGDYIALLDSDDEWLPIKLEKQLEVFFSDNRIYLIGGLITKPPTIKQTIVEIPLSKLVFKNYFQPSTVIFKKEVFNTVGFFDESQNYAEEGNYFMRIAKIYKCVLINEQLIYYGQGKGGFGVSGLSANLKEMEKGELKNLKYAFKKRYISFPIYLIAITYSILKYIRRIFIVKFRQIC
jgi:glycosyltransferase involved in cell wall biosynthesis